MKPQVQCDLCGATPPELELVDDCLMVCSVCKADSEESDLIKERAKAIVEFDSLK